MWVNYATKLLRRLYFAVAILRHNFREFCGGEFLEFFEQLAWPLLTPVLVLPLLAMWVAVTSFAASMLTVQVAALPLKAPPQATKLSTGVAEGVASSGLELHREQS